MSEKKAKRGFGFTGADDPRRHKTGRPKLPEDFKKLKNLNQKEMALVIAKAISMTVEEAKEIVKNPSANLFEAYVAKLWLNGFESGTTGHLNFFLDRTIGKVAENHNFSGNLNTSIVDLINKIENGKGDQNGIEEESDSEGSGEETSSEA